MSQMKKPPKRATSDYANALFQQQPATENGRPYSNFNASGSVEEPSISADKVLNLRQAAAVLHCHPKTLRLMAKAQKIPARRVGKLWRFSENRLRDWLEAS